MHRADGVDVTAYLRRTRMHDRHGPADSEVCAERQRVGVDFDVPCHGNHGVQRASDELVGVHDGAICLDCHEDGDKGYAAAGFDLSPNILRLIKAGHIRFTIDQQPYTQGFYPVVQLALYCRYGLVPSTMDAGAGIIDGSNVERVIELNRLHLR